MNAQQSLLLLRVSDPSLLSLALALDFCCDFTALPKTGHFCPTMFFVSLYKLLLLA